MTAYAKRCQRVYQGLKEIAHAETLERSMEKCVVAAAAPIQKTSTGATIIRTARSSCQPVISEKDQLMKEERCFSCKKVGYRTMNCLSKKKLTNELSVSCVTMQKSEQKKSHTKASQAGVLRVKEPLGEELLVEKLLIVSSSSLPGNFFAEEVLVAPCMLENNGEIKTTALLDTGATRYLFVDPVMAQRICDDLLIKPIRLSKPKAICGFDGKQAPSVTYAIYPTMTVQDHRETTTPMLITKLGQHLIILGKPWMKKHGAVLDMKTD